MFVTSYILVLTIFLALTLVKNTSLMEILDGTTKEKIAKAIRDAGLKLEDFKTRDDDHYYSLEYIGSRMHFYFKMARNDYFRFTIGFTSYTPLRPTNNINKEYFEDDALIQFHNWINDHLQKHIRSEKSIDPWKRILENPKDTSAFNTSFQIEQQFSTNELTDLENRLFNLENNLKDQLKLNEAQTKELNNGIKYLINETKKQNKFNWISIAITIFQTALPFALELDADATQFLWHQFVDYIKPDKQLA